MTSLSRQCLLLLSRDRWSLWGLDHTACLRGGGNWEKSRVEALTAELVADDDAEGGPLQLVIALEAELCLSASFPLPASRTLRRESALTYKLEESAPISAEDVVTGFVRASGNVLAVAAERAWLVPLLQSFTSAGVTIHSVSPLALLAAEAYLASGGGKQRRVLVLRDSRGADWVEVEGGKPLAWRRLSDEPEAVQREVDQHTLMRGQIFEVELLGDPNWSVGAGLRPADSDLDTTSLPTLELARRRAERILAGDAEATCELLRGELRATLSHNSPLKWERRALMTALAALVAVGIAGQLFRAHQQSELAQRLDDAQAEVFRQTFPDQRVPVGVRNRLASELRRLQGVRGAAGAPDSHHAMAVVKEVLAALPSEMRSRVLEVRIEDGRLTLSGHVRSHSDADRIAAALRQQGLLVAPPTTQQLPEQGVDFRLTAEVVAEGSAA